MNLFTKIILNVQAFRDLLYLKRNEIIEQKRKEEFQKKKICKVYGNSDIGNSTIGKYSYVAPGSILSNCEIGKFCSIGPKVVIYGNHPTSWLSTSPVFYSKVELCGISFSDKEYFNGIPKVIIGNEVWIGANVFIKAGVRVGNGVIIGAGAVVLKDIPDYAIVGGVPAKILKYRFSAEIIQKLLSIKWWDWEEDKLRENQPFFISDDLSAFLKKHYIINI